MKFQDVQMNVPFVTFQCCDLKVFHVAYLQANRVFQKIITQTKKKISCGFLHLVHLNEIFKINSLEFWTLQTLVPPPLVALKRGRRPPVPPSPGYAHVRYDNIIAGTAIMLK